MATDPIRRSAARAATLVAVPLALAVLALSALLFWPDPPATGPVSMTARELSQDAVVLCQGVIADLPESVGDNARRPVTQGTEQNAAYGDPPITLECGTSLPTIPSSAPVYGIGGVCWYPVTRDNQTVWTTVDRTIPVTVTIPDEAAPSGAAQTVMPLANAIGTTIPVRDEVPSGCQNAAPPS